MTLVYGVLILVAIAVGVVTVSGLLDPKAPEDLTDEVIAQTALQGKRRLALRWYRELHGNRLREAKPAFERLVAQYEAKARLNDV